jgi:hypothetical protein
MREMQYFVKKGKYSEFEYVVTQYASGTLFKDGVLEGQQDIS